MRATPAGRVPAGLLVLLVVVVVVACEPLAVAPSPTAGNMAGQPATLWPRPANTLDLAVAAGLRPDVREHVANHVHAHLDVFVDGQPIVVPAGIGINIDDPEVHHFDNPIGYGGIRECAAPCISPLHTHAESGILHTESEEATPNTLGEFFDEWGVTLSRTCVGELCAKPVAVYVNGVASTDDPRSIELADHREIAIVIGTPPAVIPAIADFSRD